MNIIDQMVLIALDCRTFEEIASRIAFSKHFDIFLSKISTYQKLCG